MRPIRKLAGQTAIYGLSSIIGRLVNYLLVPIYTAIFAPEIYGVVTEFYSYVAFMIVLLTYGLETAYFRFINIQEDKEHVFRTVFSSLSVTSFIFLIFILLQADAIASWLKYPDNAEYIRWFGIVLATDAVASILFARLRAHDKPLRFAILKLTGIFLNIGIALTTLVLCPYLLENELLPQLHWLINKIYDPAIGVGYVFLANMIASAVTFLLLLSSLKKIKGKWFDLNLWKNMIKYASPLLIVGLAYVINETADKVLLKYLLPYSLQTNMYYVGIYGACYKLALLMTLFIQAFRFAAEPFFFSYAKEKNAQLVYARVMDYFVIIGCMIFLMVMLYIDFFKYFIDKAYWVGLDIVPIILLANLFLGLYYNLSIWYKLTDNTRYGAYIAIFGAIITIVLNIFWIPRIGYLGSAWATLICYGMMLIASYLLSRKYYKIPYRVKTGLFYIVLAVGIYIFSIIIPFQFIREGYVLYLFNSALFISYLLIVLAVEWKSRSKRLKVL